MQVRALLMRRNSLMKRGDFRFFFWKILPLLVTDSYILHSIVE